MKYGWLGVLAFSIAIEVHADTARESADGWLSLLDQASYSRTWETAAPFFKGRVSAEAWTNSVRSARAPLGEFRDRALLGAAYQDTLPDLPPGDYVIFQFNSVFENKSLVIETLTVLRTDEGWRVTGYFLR